MKHLSKLLLVLCVFVVGFTNVYANQANVSNKIKIAFVDGNAIIEQYKASIHEKLQNEFSQRRNEVAKLEKELASLKDKLKRDEAVLSTKQDTQLRNAIASKQREFQRIGTAFNEDYTLRGNQELHDLVNIIQDVVDNVAKDQHFDFVLQRGAAVFVNGNYDITDEVLSRLQKKNIG